MIEHRITLILFQWNGLNWFGFEITNKGDRVSISVEILTRSPKGLPPCPLLLYV